MDCCPSGSTLNIPEVEGDLQPSLLGAGKYGGDGPQQTDPASFSLSRSAQITAISHGHQRQGIEHHLMYRAIASVRANVLANEG